MTSITIFRSPSPSDRQVQRNQQAFGTAAEQMPVFGTMASRFNDDGVTALYQALLPRLQALGLTVKDGLLPRVSVRHSSNQTPVVPAARREAALAREP